MKLDFVNRVAEQAELDSAARKGGLLVVFGRRRVGKTRLLHHWLRNRGGLYTQAIEAQREMQIAQVFADMRPHLETSLVPKTWAELLEILSLQKKPWSLCIDEFPYLTATDSSLPSQLQRWVDHSMPAKCLLILSGSSMRMMNDLFLNRTAPLYGRAHKLLQVRPMDYAAFCDACDLDPGGTMSFETFSCVGGIPKYWEFVESKRGVLGTVESLYFDFAPYMEQEPQRILRDEGINGLGALAVLEAIGRGAERASEVAGRLNTPQTNLSRLFQQLMDASVLIRELPYGESTRTTKKTLYRIQDPSMRFWFRVYSPHQSLWRTYDDARRLLLIHEHASTVFEDHCRALYPGSARYWEKDIELDIVAPDPENAKGIVVAEVKWRKLNAADKRQLLRDLESKWNRCALAQKHKTVRFEVLDASLLRS
jgi:uncharacterized protein